MSSSDFATQQSESASVKDAKIEALEKKVEQFAARLDEIQRKAEEGEYVFTPSELIDIRAEPKVKVELTDEGIEDRAEPAGRQGCLVSIKREYDTGDVTKVVRVIKKEAERELTLLEQQELDKRLDATMKEICPELHAAAQNDDMERNAQYSMKHNVPRL